MYEQFLKASRATQDDPLGPCSGTFSTSMGLPCAHTIREYLVTNQSLNLADIHQHWWIEGHRLLLQNNSEAKPSMSLLDPKVQRTRERPVGSCNVIRASTKRNPSAFELEEINTNSRKCSVCKRVGHNSRTCSNRTMSAD